MLEEFLFYFKKGAAAERYVSDGELFDKLVETAKESDDVKIALGKFKLTQMIFFKKRVNYNKAETLKTKIYKKGSFSYQRWKVSDLLCFSSQKSSTSFQR